MERKQKQAIKENPLRDGNFGKQKLRRQKEVDNKQLSCNVNNNNKQQPIKENPFKGVNLGKQQQKEASGIVKTKYNWKERQ